MKLLTAAMLLLLMVGSSFAQEGTPDWQDQLAKLAVDLAKDGKQAITVIVEELKDQAPELINQLLWWEGVKSSLYFIIGLPVLVISILPLRYRKRCAEKLNEEDEGVLILGFIVLFGVSVLILICNLTWLKILIAPKLFLLEYFGKIL